MSDQSAAPKERVNIIYKSATGDAKEEKELPLRTLMMGDFTQREDERAMEDRKPISVDKENFNDVMKAQNLELNFNIDNKLADPPPQGEEAEQMSVKLNFESMRDFEPDRVVQKVPEMQKMMALREALIALKGPLGNVPAFRKKLQGIIADEGVRDKLLQELGLDENA